MPTGYTAKIETGEITDVKGFALECAKAFLSEAREAKPDYKIPRKLEFEEENRKIVIEEEKKLKTINKYNMLNRRNMFYYNFIYRKYTLYT